MKVVKNYNKTTLMQHKKIGLLLPEKLEKHQQSFHHNKIAKITASFE
jgi:hypothetical protein